MYLYWSTEPISIISGLYFKKTKQNTVQDQNSDVTKTSVNCKYYYYYWYSDIHKNELSTKWTLLQSKIFLVLLLLAVFVLYSQPKKLHWKKKKSGWQTLACENLNISDKAANEVSFSRTSRLIQSDPATHRSHDNQM